MTRSHRWAGRLGVALGMLLLPSLFQSLPTPVPVHGGLCDPNAGEVAAAPDGRLLMCVTDPGWRVKC